VLAVWLFLLPPTGSGTPSCKSILSSHILRSSPTLFALHVSAIDRLLTLSFSSQSSALITPYLVDKDRANLGAKVFYLWGGLCTICFVYAYFLIPETKGLTLEQVDRMFEETTPRKSAKWVPSSSYAEQMGMTEKSAVKNIEHAEKEMV